MGRSHEMAALMSLLDRAEVERADPLLVVGEAGMGKTALLDEFARAARRRGWRVARAAAPQGGDVSAFAVVEDLAHCLPEHVERLSEDDARLLRAPPRDGTVGPAHRPFPANAAQVVPGACINTGSRVASGSHRRRSPVWSGSIPAACPT